jgi:hypothetical protein
MLFACTAYSFITGFIFYNFNTYNDTMYDELLAQENVGNMSMYLDNVYNVEGAVESEKNFFSLISKYKNRLGALNRDAFNSSKDGTLSSYVEVNQTSRDAIYNYCTGIYAACYILLYALCYVPCAV